MIKYPITQTKPKPLKKEFVKNIFHTKIFWVSNQPIQIYNVATCIFPVWFWPNDFTWYCRQAPYYIH